MKIAILTTAINRPDLHTIVFEKLFKSNFLKNIDVDWYVNIDAVPTLKDTFELTQENFLSITKNSNRHRSIKNITFLKQQTPDFRNACRILLTKALEKEYDAYFWLEDDWDLTNTDLLLKDMLPQQEWDTISLKLRSEPCNFNPMLMNRKIASYLLLGLNMNDSGDPEIIFEKSCLNLIRNHFILPKLFEDLGRDWMKDKKIVKWSRRNIKDQPVTYTIKED